MTDSVTPPTSDDPADQRETTDVPQPELGAHDPVAADAPSMAQDKLLIDEPRDLPSAEPERVAASPIANHAGEGAVSPLQSAHDTPAPQKSGSTLVGILIGAVIAGGVGYGVQRYTPPPPQAVYDDTALAARLTATEAEAQALRAELARLSETPAAAPAPDLALTARVDAVEAALQAIPQATETPDLTPLASRIDGLEANLAALANTPSETGVSPAALTALQADVAALKSQETQAPGDLTTLIADVETRLAEAEARATALAEQSTAIAAAAARNAALGQIAAAFDSGLPYRAALTALGDTGVPDVIAAQADTGVPTIADLRDSYPAVARLALEQALRANPGESWTDRVGTFLRNQTGARSLAPREGTDPDAVLSRAEAALAGSDVAAALAELAALPPEGQAALADWTARAQLRLDAETALTGLLQDAGQ